MSSWTRIIATWNVWLFFYILVSCCGWYDNSVVHAYPSGAGTCNIGKSLNDTRMIHGWFVSGTLNDGTYVVTLQDNNNNDILLKATPTTTTTTTTTNSNNNATTTTQQQQQQQQLLSLSTGINYKLTLTSDANEDFRGFLFRLGGSKEDDDDNDDNDSLVVDASSLLEAVDSDTSKDQGSCGNQVAGVTHRNSRQKTRMDVTMTFAQSAIYQLDVAVVRDNSPKEHDWYFSSYIFNVTGPDTTTSSSSSAFRTTTTITTTITSQLIVWCITSLLGISIAPMIIF